MGNVWVREFTGGLDTRKLPETSKGGSLIRAIDGHINRGGEFEQRAAFVKLHTLPQDKTLGLAFTRNGLIVFGHEPAPDMPSGVAYQRLQHANGGTSLARIESFDQFSGRIYAAARFADGALYHYYDGARVTDFGAAGLTPGPFVRTYGQKMNFIAGPIAAFSGLKLPTSYNTDSVGAGFIDLSEEDYGSENLTSIGKYQNYLAFFSDRTVQIRYMDPDPAQSRAIQALQNTGTLSPRSVVQFGDNDLFYLDSSGIRSLRARDSSNAAATTDVGSAIDNLVTSLVSTLPTDVTARAIGLIEPRDGRYWLILGDVIFVFSYFPAAKVSAWTTYRPGFAIQDAVVFKRRVYVRSGDDIYVYGGLGEVLTYDDTSAVAWLPYLDGENPTREKMLNGIDTACRGTWRIDAAMDPTNLDASDHIAIVTETTYTTGRIPFQHRTTHFSLRVSSVGSPSEGGPCIMGAANVHYEPDSDESKS